MLRTLDAGSICTLALFDTQEQIVKPFVLVVLLPDALMITIARFCRSDFCPTCLSLRADDACRCMVMQEK